MIKTAVMVILALLLPSSASGRAEYRDEPIYASLAVPIFFETEIPRDIALVNNAVDEITKREIGAKVQLIPLLHPYSAQDPLSSAELEMLKIQGITFDVYPSVLPGVEPLALDELMDVYGRETLAIVGDFRLSYYRAEGKLYRIPAVNDDVASVGVAMRRDVAERYGVDVSAIHTLEDLDALFARIQPNEPDLYMISPFATRYGILSRYKSLLTLPSSFMSVSEDDPTLLVNIYEMDAYREAVRMIRRWHEAGYLPKTMSVQNIRATQLVKSGELFAYFCSYKPGIDSAASKSCGYEMVTASMIEPTITRQSLEAAWWSVSAECANPGKAAQLLNLMYTNEELVNLLVNGVENVHYVALDDGTIDYPPGMDAEEGGYGNTLGSLLPNQALSRVWRGDDPNLWDTMRARNASAPVSETLYFSFSAEPVLDEFNRVNHVVSEYAYGLETGQLDPEIYLPQMLAKMAQAGCEQVLAEAQRQFSAFFDRGNEG
ncbi:MAG: ABC transporter substrate-binding protein [Oscillospiraceae bacterium]|jgi:putative aldouronate transport system substrate-binding protein|nr:ABC transporter substrate-binding protein [Oscillospiraceae bacterium]